MLYFGNLAGCPTNCDACETTDTSNLKQTNSPEIRKCTKCSPGFYWDSTKKACTGKCNEILNAHLISDVVCKSKT